MWKGSISFGLVSIPVKMFAATEEKDIRFRYLHKTCNTPVRYVKRCPQCNEDIGDEDIVRGFEIEKGRFVILSEDDFASISPEKSKAIDILDFVQLSDIDPIFFHKSYFLSPEETSLKAYSLLREAMQSTGKIAIAKIVLRSSASLAALRLYQDSLVLETLFYPDEVRSVRETPLYGAHPTVDPREMDMASALIAHLSAPFVPEKYTDDYRQSLWERIQAKAQGETVTAASATSPRGNVVDLMAALQKSIEAAKAGNGGPPQPVGATSSEGAPTKPRRTRKSS
ncbi:MAG: Ku protein [Firmicutes bacterium]|nr:Ku protein [Bacillota bacterium]